MGHHIQPTRELPGVRNSDLPDMPKNDRGYLRSGDEMTLCVEGRGTPEERVVLSPRRAFPDPSAVGVDAIALSNDCSEVGRFRFEGVSERYVKARGPVSS